MTDEEKIEEKRLADLAEEKRLAELNDAEALKGVDKDKLTELVNARVAAELKEIKEKLNSAYGARDEAKKRAEELENAAKEAHKKRLEDEGKHTELLQLELKEEREKRALAEKRNTELSRDVAVRAALNGLDFRNERAAELAYKEIVGQLTQDSKGEWAHRSGIAIADFIADFAKDEAQSFLFKSKRNNGAGSTDTGDSTTPKPKTSLFNMSQAEVLKMAEQGKLPNQRK